MSFIEAVFLGIVQGLTEFLPISSSGHLVLAQAILGIKEDGIAFEIFVHFGTLLSVITVYRHDLFTIMRDFLTFLNLKLKNKKSQENPSHELSGLRLLIFIIVGTLPTAILGFLFRGTFESAFSNAGFVSGALIFTGVILSATRYAHEKKMSLNYSKSLLIGLAQVVAFFPGVSRSGTTIGAGLMLGIRPDEAAKYSFLMAIPLILGVTLIKSFEIIVSPPPLERIVFFAAGCVSAYLSGLWAIRWLIAAVQKGRFDRFAYYCFGIGILGLILNFTK